jgi:citrate lyase subunit beta/citryl-CoA lyase
MLARSQTKEFRVEDRYMYLATRADGGILLEKAARSAAHAMMLDLEDGVPPQSKETAREALRTALKEIDWGTKFKMVRVNEIQSDEFLRDITLVDASPDCFLIPMIFTPEDVKYADEKITEAERDAGVEVGRTRMYVMLETGQAILRAFEVLSASPRMAGGLFGHVDFTVNVRCDYIENGGFRVNPTIGDAAHAQIIMATHALGLEAVAAAVPRMRDDENQVRQMRRLLGMGYDGILSLSPKQLDMVQQARVAEPVDLEFAQGVVDAFAEALKNNTSVGLYNDWVIEAPMAETAQKLLDRAND